MKKLLTMSMVALLGVSALLTGCGSQGDSSKEKVLVVGTNADFAPFEFTEGNDNEYKGFDMDLARAIGKEMGYKVEIKNMQFDGLIPALQTDKIDMIAAGMSITPEREKAVAFSKPYYTSGLTIVVPKANTDIKSFKDLQGKAIGVQIGTASQAEAQKVKDADVKPLNSSVDVFMELNAGHVDAIINDKPINAYMMKTTNNTNLKVLDEVLASQQYGLAMKKDNTELVAKVNAALLKLKQNGEYAKLYEKWFGTKPSEADLNSLN